MSTPPSSLHHTSQNTSIRERSPLLSFTPHTVAFLFNIRRTSSLKFSHTPVDASASYRFNKDITLLSSSTCRYMPFTNTTTQQQKKAQTVAEQENNRYIQTFSHIVSANKHSKHMQLHLCPCVSVSLLPHWSSSLRH